MNSQAMLNPVPSDTAIRDTIAILIAVSDADAQRTFLAAVVDRSKAAADAVLDAGRTELAQKQAAADALMGAAQRAQAEVEVQKVSANALNTTYAEQHAAAMARANDELAHALDLAKEALASKAKYDGLLADLKARVGAD